MSSMMMMMMMMMMPSLAWWHYSYGDESPWLTLRTPHDSTWGVRGTW